MTRMKRCRAVGFVVLAGVATFPRALAGEAHIKYIYELGASSNDGANPGNLLEWIDGSLYGAAGATNSNCGSLFRIVDGAGGALGSWDCAAGSLNPAGLAPGADGNLSGSATGLERKFSTVFRLTPGGQTTPFVRIPFADGFDFSQLVPFGEGSFFVSAMGGGPGDFCTGSIGCGTILRIRPTREVALVAAFSAGATDPVNPNGLVLAKDGNLYGTSFTSGPGSNGYYGTVFQVDPKGGVRIIREFYNQDTPESLSGPLTLAPDGSMYGAGEFGGNVEGGND